MARTFISQPTQVFSSEVYDDTWASGDGLQTGSTNIEYDLNALRSQVRRIWWGDPVTGNWYDGVTGSLNPRGLNVVNTGLYNIEQKMFMFRRQAALNTGIYVPSGSNFVLLSASLSQTPADPMAIGASALTGSVVALLSGSSGTYGSFSIAQVSGSSPITPKNVCVVRDAFTGDPIIDFTSGSREVYALIQVESGSISGDSFNDSNRRSQLSFIVEGVSGTLVPATGLQIGGHTINYQYNTRVNFSSMPEDAYLSDTLFVDVIVTSGSALFSDITLQNAINNQVGAVTQNKNITDIINAGFSWTFQSGTTALWQLASSNTGNSLVTNVANWSLSSSNPAGFQQGITVATGSTPISIGVTPGTVSTLTASNLVLSGGKWLVFGDGNQIGTPFSNGVSLSTSSAEWNTFASYFGTSTSVLGALNSLSASISGSVKRLRYNAGVISNLGANVNVTYPTNLDAQLPSWAGKNFVTDFNIYVNGVLLLPSTGTGDLNDVYPGTTAATGDLKFTFKLRSGSIVTVEKF